MATWSEQSFMDHTATGHHLILGELTDYLTGITRPDTHDERYRQKIARFLVHQKAYLREDIIPRYDLRVVSGAQTAIIQIDFVIRLHDRPLMLVKYGPGSLVSRYQPALAAARLIASWQLPLVVVTNGKTADVLSGFSGRVIASGLDGIPNRNHLLEIDQNDPFRPVDTRRREQAARILYAFEVNDRCPCDDDGCVRVL